MIWLKQSTQVTVVIGPVWSTSDGALKGDLAYNAAGINCDLYKAGTKADVTLAGSSGDGYWRAGSGEAQYLLTLSAGHTDTLGALRLTLSATGFYAKPVDFMVLPANVWDSLFGADYLQVDEAAIAAAVIAGLGARTVTIASPVAKSGDITIYQGDDYTAAEGRALTFAVSDASHALGLDQAGAQVRLKLAQATWTATAITETETGYQVTFEPNAGQTAVLTDDQEYELEATTQAGSIITIQTGFCTVKSDI